ncbi:hypothetical protein BU26DRAFT_23795 [Trematosphaeria pertusa]|uniref:SnoaL-like domain-containing protein n=1 Tax=Trematosphaeria pertusa TaxID=390896 RepID=A0A6A6J4V5_9PLEO|nr:uncharacterized protein BU26DRAFT_23795 [Trematosphaeria pertusa]KAF2256523.1 hypothetical protein BU26DRAFT_23795 [Trematosphaeria pertusa]
MLLAKTLALLGATVLARAASNLDALARDVSRVESIREIKDVQRSFAQLAQFGRWNSMASLFSSNGTLMWGNATAHGPAAVETWLRTDAGKMDGIQPGSLDTIVMENPLVNMAADGQTAKTRWNGLRFQGDGVGGTRIQGGIYENEYVRTEEGWRISLLRYYAMYEGPYFPGFRNVGGRSIPVITYHFTPEDSGIPIPPAVGEASRTNVSVEGLERRIARMNDEDDVRNLMHAHGYYVDRRMWTDVVDLHTTNTTVRVTNGANYTGLAGVRRALERMGPEGLTKGINNDHLIFDMIVDVHPDGKTAIARGSEVAMIGNANNRTASWEFNVFRNHFVKEDGLWKVQTIETTPLIVADYYKGWGTGGLKPANTYIPPFLDATGLRAKAIKQVGIGKVTRSDLEDLQRRLQRAAAYDGAENQSHAYGYFLDDIDCARMGALFAKRGHKASPFAGFFITPERVAQACFASYGTNRSALRSGISFHWRPQPVVLVSEDGRSATLRARLLQPSTAVNKSGSFNSAIYHDQMVLEDGKWRLWSVTIDEFYWQSSSWEGGWSDVKPRNESAPDPEPASWTKKYPPDLSIAAVGDRESTFRGGSGRYIEWPEIQRMWWQYRNPVSGRVPEYYWPGCVPCKAIPDWALEANGYQEPTTGPSMGNGTAVNR